MKAMNSKIQKRPTIRDVAKLAGVSPSTVSFVINNTKGQTISEETRERIIDCAKQLGYRSSYSATRIRRGNARTIAVLSSYRREALYFLDMINGVASETSAAGFGLIFCPCNREKEPRLCLDYYQEGRIDGVVFISSAHSEQDSMEKEYIDFFQSNHIPFTVVYGYTRHDGICYSNANMYADGYNATRALIDRGCRSIQFIGALDKFNKAPYLPQTEQARRDGYLNAVHEANLDGRVAYFPRSFRSSAHQEIIRQTLSLPADAYFVCWATLGLQLLDLLRSMGLRIPQDVRVIAADTLPYLDYTVPSLSAIRVPFQEMASYATRALIQMLNGKNEAPKSISFDGYLEIRDSI